MPLKIVWNRNAKTKNAYIRGSYLGVAVDKSCRTDRRSVARGMLRDLEGKIERGEYPPREAPARREQPVTFLAAAVAYLEAGKRRRYVKNLIRHFGETPIAEIDQAAIDAAAVALHPNCTAATRNTCVYTPVSAILHHVGVDIEVKRPAGAKGRIITDFLFPDDAFGIIAAAETFDREYALYLKFLLYTGTRVGEPLDLAWESTQLEEAVAWLPTSKNGDPRMLRLRDDLRDELASHRGEKASGRLFRFRQGGHHKHLLMRAKLAYLGLPCPVRRPTGWRQPANRLAWVNHKTFRHTWASWMRRYGGLDLQGLVATNTWRDPRSAARYAHVVAREEWERVEQLPTVGNTRGARRG